MFMFMFAAVFWLTHDFKAVGISTLSNTCSVCGVFSALFTEVILQCANAYRSL